MPAYSKIQQIRDAKRRERQQKWKQKKRKESKELSVSLRGSEKKAEGKYNKFLKVETERKTNARERKRRSRAMNKERNELQKLEKENMCRRKTEKQRRHNY